MNASTASLDARAAAIAAGDRRALARAITLVESTRPDHRTEAESLIERVLPHTGNSTRIGLSGVPGVGKSTFIEAFGLKLIGHGHRVAVLAVDPSSRRTGGSILGDKTRMTELARAEAAFIRPSPTGGTLGGVARRTRESILLCEAAGFDVILVETVGVGQSETAVADMVDLFCLLLLPSAGDDLQGIKKGIVELAELLLVNKADGELISKARTAVGDYRAALRLLRPLSPLWQPEVLPVSAVTGEGLDLAWAAIERHQAALDTAGEKTRRRAGQAQAALWADLGDGMIEVLRHRPAIAERIPEIEAAVAAGTMTSMAGARRLLGLFLGE
ncbi:MAG TPA: methylmalonyl Co-A mutase-associated GTPase MeaB [Aliidongia sp.]|uniref:methylmalonyl Co-A mutase-associated GTPase MeaB n=1 Tax=Aliidongia sp. TaxID=1914230 RepID=UPI002DDD29D1|nr:methylmalonyl Co-A mutase-associated GTPase MeaB [Aliidongia sp.]HEV2676463.1 methylmalonyl Co-A mutase-associated GTPase MeaB [Aliidongia sp.]